MIPQSTLLIRAANFAAQKHKAQQRKGSGEPYIVHPLGVATILSEEAGISDPATLAAALLHDCIEDTDSSAEELRQYFGEEITELVLELSDDMSLPKATRKREQIRKAGQLSPKACLVKMADKLHNLRDIERIVPENWSPERVRGYFTWSHEVIKRLSHQHAGMAQALDRLFDSLVPAAKSERALLLEDYLESLHR
ncbi:MAG: phosphohydrolase [Planctomycetota bacterium]|nr:MAG: phosphohydrolase [Planctomycetota bacterium]